MKAKITVVSFCIILAMSCSYNVKSQDHRTTPYKSKLASTPIAFNTLIGLLDIDSASAEQKINEFGYTRSKSDTSVDAPYFDSSLANKQPERMTTGIGIGHYYMIKAPCILIFRNQSGIDMLYYTFPMEYLANFKKALLSHKDIIQKEQQVLYYENKNLYYINERYNIPDYLQKHYDISINYTDSFATACIYKSK